MRSVLSYLSLFLILVVFHGCGSISILGGGSVYSDKFIKQLESIKLIYRDGDKQLALQKIDQMNDQTITQAEQAKKYNFKGVLLFSMGDLDGALENFQTSNNLVSSDRSLANNIRLNTASAYYKLNKFESVASWLKEIDIDYLKEKEQKNYYRLSFSVGIQNGDHRQVVGSLIYLTKDLKSFKQVEDYKYKEILIDNFKKMSASERVDVLDKNDDVSKATIAFLGKQEAMNRFYTGDKPGSQDVVDWLSSNFGSMIDVKTFVDDYNFRVAAFSRINSGAVGVIGPFSGRYGRFGKKIVAGVNTALNKFTGDQTLNLYLKDNQNNPFLAKNQVKELAMKHNVSAIIGGLFPSLAKEEYLEARKYGILYISLSPVFLPRSEKDHLLIEVSGSVESQINGVMKPELLEFLGKKVAILYPWSDEGKSYVNELWGLHNQEKLELTSLNHFEKGITDYRDSIKALLGLKYPRERKEEAVVWTEIKKLKQRGVRIINVLPPVVDFDWVLIPSIPSEAVQIIPTFSFYDAKKLKIVGGPSWINKHLQKQRKASPSRLFVIGNDTKKIGADFIDLYREHNGVSPHLVDTLSYDAMNIALNILAGQKFTKRDELTKKVLSQGKLVGLTSYWDLKDGLWLKDMDVLEVGRSGFRKLDFESNE